MLPSNTSKVFNWLSKQNIRETELPQTQPLYQIFQGEFYWSPAYKYSHTPYYQGGGWSRGFDSALPAKVLVTTEKYGKEGNGYDCSIDIEGININVPAFEIVEGMGLTWRGEEGRFHNNVGKLIAYDPAVFTDSPSTLLVRKEEFIQFLEQNSLEIIWVNDIQKSFTNSKYQELENWLALSGIYRLNKLHNIVGKTIDYYYKEK